MVAMETSDSLNKDMSYQINILCVQSQSLVAFALVLKMLQMF